MNVNNNNPRSGWFANTLGIGSVNNTVETVGNSANQVLTNFNQHIVPLSNTIQTVGANANQVLTKLNQQIVPLGENTNRFLENLNAKTTATRVLENLSDFIQEFCLKIEQGQQISPNDFASIQQKLEHFLQNSALYFNIPPEKEEEWRKINEDLNKIPYLLLQIQNADLPSEAILALSLIYDTIHGFFLQQQTPLASTIIVVLERVEKIAFKWIHRASVNPQELVLPYTEKLKERRNKPVSQKPAFIEPVTDLRINEQKDLLVFSTVHYSIGTLIFWLFGIKTETSHEEVVNLVNKATNGQGDFIDLLIKHLEEKQDQTGLQKPFGLIKRYYIRTILYAPLYFFINFYLHHTITNLVDFFKNHLEKMDNPKRNGFINDCINLATGVLDNTTFMQGLIGNLEKFSKLDPEVAKYILSLCLVGGTKDQKMNTFVADTDNPALKEHKFDDTKFTLYMIDTYLPHLKWTEKLEAFFSLMFFPQESLLSILNGPLWLISLPFELFLKTLVFIPQKILDSLILYWIKKTIVNLNPSGNLRNIITPSLKKGAAPLLSAPHVHIVNTFLLGKLDFVLNSMRSLPDFTKEAPLTIPSETEDALRGFVNEFLKALMEQDPMIKKTVTSTGEIAISTLLIQSMKSIIGSLDPVVANISKKEELLQYFHTGLYNLQTTIFTPSSNKPSQEDKDKVARDVETRLLEITFQVLENLFDTQIPTAKARAGVYEYFENIEKSIRKTFDNSTKTINDLNKENADQVIEAAYPTPFEKIKAQIQGKGVTFKQKCLQDLLLIGDNLNKELSSHWSNTANDSRIKDTPLLKHLQLAHEQVSKILVEWQEAIQMKNNLEETSVYLDQLKNWALRQNPYYRCKKLLQETIFIAESPQKPLETRITLMKDLITQSYGYFQTLQEEHQQELQPLLNNITSAHTIMQQNYDLQLLLDPLRNIQGLKPLLQILEDKDLKWQEKLTLINRIELLHKQEKFLTAEKYENFISAVTENTADYEKIIKFLSTAGEQEQQKNALSFTNTLDQLKASLQALPHRDPFKIQIPPNTFDKIAKPASIFAAKYIIPKTLIPQVIKLLQQEYLTHELFNRTLLWLWTGVSIQKPLKHH